MPRKRRHVPLRVFLNNRLVGHLHKESGGAVSFRYHETWAAMDLAIPVSLSLPVREDAYRGEAVMAFFDNLLPDSDALRRRVAGKVGASGTDAFSLLTQIGRDCVGALQFIPDDDDTALPDTSHIDGIAISDKDIESLLKNLAEAPLGLDQDRDFRISVAGAQEKTALLWHEGQWLKPRGTTPTSHIFKTQIGSFPNGLDLSNSVENEYYCLKLFHEFGLPVNPAEIKVFGQTKALVIERFDRQWTEKGRLLRLPQEDCCQALSTPPGRKYQTDGGPGMIDILRLLARGDTPARDQKNFLKAQMLFWLTGATDGHAKNFSILLRPGGSFGMTPLYDVLTAQPSLDTHQLERRQMKLAMSVGNNRHYRLDMIQVRHFVRTAECAALPGSLAKETFDEIASTAAGAFANIEKKPHSGFPEQLYASVKREFLNRMNRVGN